MFMWEGRFKKNIDTRTNDFNSSIHFDNRMYKQDIMGSIAHTKMLAKQGIILKEDGVILEKELLNILNELENGDLKIDYTSEDIHMFIENVLTKRLGNIGKKVHTARSRNDQVALDLRLYLRDEIIEIHKLLNELIKSFINKAKENIETIMPGYTHLQRAQPITLASHLMAYVEMLKRDCERLENCNTRLNVSPLGCCALATTTYNIDRNFTKKLLGFNNISKSSIDGVSDRDFVIELASAISIIMMHLSRFSEEVILWCSCEFKYIELDDAFSTGSSIMPQKKNPDICELIRGKTGRAYGNLITLLTVMKGLPLAYNKDMQEDKEAIFDSIDTVKKSITTLIPMIDTMKVLKENMKKAAQEGFINATDCADYLVKKGMAFRDAYKITGQIVSYCIDNNKTLDSLSLQEYQNICNLFENDIYIQIDLSNCLKARNVEGGPSPEKVKNHIKDILN